jgi:hypothetical protein
MMNIFGYLRNLSNARLILWAYFLWYLIVASYYFEPSIGVWLNSLGIALFVGFSLYLNLLGGDAKPNFWQIARCFMTPFCVSSFSALVKHKNFFLIFSPDVKVDLIGLAAIVALTVAVIVARRFP